MNKKEMFKRNRAALQIDEDWEIIAEDIAKERDGLKKEIEELKGTSSDMVSIDPNLCVNWAYSDRNDFELGDIDELAEDIKKNGQLQPVIVRKVPSLDDRYEIIAGERRWRACSLAGVPLKAIVTDSNDTDCLVIQTSENKKKSLSLFSLSKVYMRMMKDKNISQNKMAELLNIPKGSFSQILSFNKVPNEIWATVKDMSNISARTANYIARECEKGNDYVQAFQSLSEYIREGRGIDFLSNKIDKYFSNKKQNRSRTLVQKNKDGKVLFRITETGRITLNEYVTKKYSVDEIAARISEVLA